MTSALLAQPSTAASPKALPLGTAKISLADGVKRAGEAEHGESFGAVFEAKDVTADTLAAVKSSEEPEPNTESPPNAEKDDSNEVTHQVKQAPTTTPEASTRLGMVPSTEHDALNTTNQPVENPSANLQQTRPQKAATSGDIAAIQPIERPVNIAEATNGQRQQYGRESHPAPVAPISAPPKDNGRAGAALQTIGVAVPDERLERSVQVPTQNKGLANSPPLHLHRDAAGKTPLQPAINVKAAPQKPASDTIAGVVDQGIVAERPNQRKMLLADTTPLEQSKPQTPPKVAQLQANVPQAAQPAVDKTEIEQPLPERVGSNAPQTSHGLADGTAQVATKTVSGPSVAQTAIYAFMDRLTAAGQDMSPQMQSEPGEIVQWDLRAAQSFNAPTATAPLTQRADMPPHVAQQLAVALQKSPDKPVEIALNPPELGRVRMVMNASETGVVVQVLTERTDTLDLMRRNIDDLGRALSDLGYDDISFSFGQDEKRDSQTDSDDTPTETKRIDLDDITQGVTTSNAQTPALAIAPDSIDIRL